MVIETNIFHQIRIFFYDFWFGSFFFLNRAEQVLYICCETSIPKLCKRSLLPFCPMRVSVFSGWILQSCSSMSSISWFLFGSVQILARLVVYGDRLFDISLYVPNLTLTIWFKCCRIVIRSYVVKFVLAQQVREGDFFFVVLP